MFRLECVTRAGLLPAIADARTNTQSAKSLSRAALLPAFARLQPTDRPSKRRKAAHVLPFSRHMPILHPTKSRKVPSQRPKVETLYLCYHRAEECSRGRGRCRRSIISRGGLGGIFGAQGLFLIFFVQSHSEGNRQHHRGSPGHPHTQRRQNGGHSISRDFNG